MMKSHPEKCRVLSEAKNKTPITKKYIFLQPHTGTAINLGLSEDSKETEKNPEKVEKTEQKEDTEVKRKSTSLLVSTTSAAHPVVFPDNTSDPTQSKEVPKPGTNHIMSIVKNSKLNPNARCFYPKQYPQQVPTPPQPQTQSQVIHVMPKPGQQIKQQPQPKQGVSFGQTTLLGATTSAPATGFSFGVTTQTATGLTLGGSAKTTSGPTFGGIAQAKPGFSLGGTISQPASGLGGTPQSYAKGFGLGGTTQTSTAGFELGAKPPLHTDLTIGAAEIKIGQATSAVVSIRPPRTATAQAEKENPPDMMPKTASCQVVQRKMDNICMKEQDMQIGVDGEQMQEKAWKESDEVKDVQDQERGQIKKLKRTKGGAYLTQPAGTQVAQSRHLTDSIGCEDTSEQQIFPSINMVKQTEHKMQVKLTKGRKILMQPSCKSSVGKTPFRQLGYMHEMESNAKVKIPLQEATEPPVEEYPIHLIFNSGAQPILPRSLLSLFTTVATPCQFPQIRVAELMPLASVPIAYLPVTTMETGAYQHRRTVRHPPPLQFSPSSLNNQQKPLQEPTELPIQEYPIQLIFNSGAQPILPRSLLSLFTSIATPCQFPQKTVAELMPLASVPIASLPVTTMETGAHQYRRTVRHQPPLQFPPSSLNNQQV
ncbi:NUPL1 [Mytilus coruscus]|uniref:NUPL1 n=1 Tax=Mytilus coruscus TaxID=42192 RepID=A0A6J8CWS7_MYTCO|nr:NUPL1 [Mytilus coruscus]